MNSLKTLTSVFIHFLAIISNLEKKMIVNPGTDNILVVAALDLCEATTM